MTEDADNFRPLPDEFRTRIAELSPPPADWLPDAPDWARTLTAGYNSGEIDFDELRALELPEDRESDAKVTISFEGVLIEFLLGGGLTAIVSKPKAQASGEWMHRRIGDYWDPRADAIDVAGRKIRELTPEQRSVALAEIQEAVTKHVEALSDETLVTAAAIVADDLYSSGCSIGWWSEDLGDYLRASAGTFSRLLSERGFELQYLVENYWEDLERPLEHFPDWYRAAGIIYCCPQMAIRKLAEYDGLESEDEIAPVASRYAEEARAVVEQLVAKCQEHGDHFIHLEADAAEEIFERNFPLALKRRGAKGVLTVERVEAPGPGTEMRVSPPEGLSFLSPEELGRRST